MEQKKYYMEPSPTGKRPEEIAEPNAQAVLNALIADGWQVRWQISPSYFACCPVCDTANRDRDIGATDPDVNDGPPTWITTCVNGHLFQYRKLKLVRPCRLVTDDGRAVS
jgi:hypothetical protein